MHLLGVKKSTNAALNQPGLHGMVIEKLCSINSLPSTPSNTAIVRWLMPEPCFHLPSHWWEYHCSKVEMLILAPQNLPQIF